MPKRYFSKIKEEVRLDPAERLLMRSRLAEFVSDNPVHQPSGRFAWLGPALASILLVGGSVSFAAQRALPGDLLYPIKTNINERAWQMFTIEPAAHARLEENLAQRRLEEARILQVQGRLSVPLKARVSAEAVGHIEAAQAKIAELKISGATTSAAEAEMNLSTSLGLAATSTPAQVRAQVEAVIVRPPVLNSPPAPSLNQTLSP